MPVTIRHARFPEENSQVLALFAAYAESLGVDLTFQNFQKKSLRFLENMPPHKEELYYSLKLPIPLQVTPIPTA